MTRRSILITAPIFALLALELLASANGVGFNFDTTPPNIGAPSIQPSSPGPSDVVTVSLIVQDPDSPVKNVSMFYTTDDWHSVNKTLVASYNNNTQVATAQIPAQPNGGRVDYYIIAFDPSGNRGVNNNSGNYYGYNITNPSSLSTWLLIAVASTVGSVLLGLGVYSKRKKSQSTRTPSTTP